MKEIKITFYGKLTELVGKDQEIVQTDASTIADLTQFLRQRYPVLDGLSMKMAQNNVIETSQSLLTSSSIDIFPPFFGG